MFRKCVGAIIVERESVLLGKRTGHRTSYPNVWDVFGGHIESGESYRQALDRELSEELGIVPTRVHFLETLTLSSSNEIDRMECHFYIVTEWNGTPTNQQPQEHSEIRWFRFGETSRLQLATPEYSRILEDVRRHAMNGINNLDV